VLWDEDVQCADVSHKLKGNHIPIHSRIDECSLCSLHPNIYMSLHVITPTCVSQRKRVGFMLCCFYGDLNACLLINYRYFLLQTASVLRHVIEK
jgi:hypothetical protein